MPQIDIIKSSEAPQPPKKLSKIAEQLVGALSSLKKDEVIRLKPDDGKSVRGLKTSVGRVASNAGIKTDSYDTGDGYLYVRKVDK